MTKSPTTRLLTLIGVGMIALLILRVDHSTASPSACAQAGQTLANAYGPVPTLVASYSVTVGAFSGWHERDMARKGISIRSQWRARPESEQIAVCYFDGTFDTFPRKGPPLAPGQVIVGPSPYERIVVIVDASGAPSLFAAGYRETLPVVDPSNEAIGS